MIAGAGVMACTYHMNRKERGMPIAKDQWDAFLAAVARNTVRREHGEQPRAPSPTCEACQGTGWVAPWFDDLGKLKMRVPCGCTLPQPN